MEFIEAFEKLRGAFAEVEKREAEKRRFERTHPRGLVDERLDLYESALRQATELAYRYLRELIECPPHHQRHVAQLSTFRANVGPRSRTVFVMTKYPEGDSALDRQLQHVISVVEESVKSCGYVPCLAGSNPFVENLWENVELQLLGSGLGIAIVEDVYKPELNPNVALEWGWMRGMGRQVLYLGERNFAHGRADLSGLIKYHFDWARPEDHIPSHVSNWLRLRRTP
jgi:hypothetical protein